MEGLTTVWAKMLKELGAEEIDYEDNKDTEKVDSEYD